MADDEAREKINRGRARLTQGGAVRPSNDRPEPTKTALKSATAKIEAGRAALRQGRGPVSPEPDSPQAETTAAASPESADTKTEG